ncbi:MAG: DUF2066 domain-containing protein [Rhodospirillales bacterium]
MQWIVPAVFFAMAWVIFPRCATASDPYTVSAISVDLTRETSAIARQEAIESAHTQAFNRLFKRLSFSRETERLPEITYSLAADLTAGLKIDDEVTSETRYAAEITISFIPEQVRKLFQERDIEFVDKAAPQIVVVPVFAHAGALSLWEQNNPWRASWSFIKGYDGLTPVILPKGDLVDLGSLSALQAAERNQQRLSALAARYGAAGVLLAQATYWIDFETGNPRLDVAVEVLGDGPALDRFKYSKTGTFASSPEELFKDAAHAVMEELDGVWKRKSSSSGASQKSTLVVDFQITNITDFGDVRRRLDALPNVTRQELLALSKDRARLRIFFDGTSEAIRTSIAKQNMDLVPAGPGGQVDWVLIAAPKRD